MLRNFIHTAIRNIIRNRIQSLIQVFSLVIGITAFILIGLYTQNEMSVDRFNENFDRIYRLEFGTRVGQPTAPGHQIAQHFSEVEHVVRLVNWLGKDDFFDVAYMPEEDSGKIISLKVDGVFWCDTSIFEMFTFNFVQGDPGSPLKDPNSCILSESTARRIFGNEDPIGKSLWGGAVSVTGIFKDLRNSHMKINMLMPLTSNNNQYGYQRGDPEFLNNYWPDHSYITYLLLRENSHPEYVENRINEYFRENSPLESGIDFNMASYSLRPLKDVYFSTDVTSEKNYCRHGNMKTLRIIIAIAIFVLLLVVINYVNLTTARISMRAKEVGIRKVTGSTKNMLIGQFLVESILITIFSFFIALFLVSLLLPGFNQQVSADMDLKILLNPVNCSIIIASVILTGTISGFYPAILLTRYKPVESLSGQQIRVSGSLTLRRVLLTFQFFISIVLLAGVIVVYRQLNYMKTSDLGFNMESIINTSWTLWNENPAKRRLVREELTTNPGVKGVAFSGGIMGGESMVFPYSLIVEGEKKQINSLGIDPEFLDFMEIELVEGRNFSRDRPADYNGLSCMVNETAVRELNLEEPVGTFLPVDLNFSFEIIGVVEDVHFRSYHEKIEPCLYLWSSWMMVASIKLEPHEIPATLKFIKEKLENLEPGYFFDYTFLKDSYEMQYVKDEQSARIVRNFAIVAILIACLGLFGLSSFMAVRKTKEMGIRKIMGATDATLFLLLSREFFTWVTLSVILASPLSWIILNRWLQDFAYHTRISLWIFILVALIAYSVTILTIAWQTLKTARANPVESLRYE